ncbi:HAD family hydrolase [Polymorphobacter multimanifer]|nr:HAD family hydrolase [Polymorphobacter multimanifer]
MMDPDWQSIRLVVFDMDGTLYRQRPVRLAMLQMLLRDVFRSRSTRTLRVLADYRRTREQLADARTEDFDAPLVARVAARAGITQHAVEQLVEDWIETRPLPHLRRAMVPGADALFAALRNSGRRIGVLSDYPAAGKLAALGLAADHVVAARDVGVMKPHPRGLQALMAAASVEPAHTLMIGDRLDRDSAAAAACDVRALLHSPAPIAGQHCFTSFLDPLFAPLLTQPRATATA